MSSARASGLRVDNVQAYLPGDRRRALAAGTAMPDRVHGCTLFGDISGFTALAESLAVDFGAQRGAEELTEALDAVFGPLLDELERWGGDVIYFSGDAVTAWIDGDDGLLGVACATALQKVMDDVGLRVLPNGREFQLRLKVAVAAGDARRFVVGDPDVQLIDVLAGDVMDRLATAERQAQPGEVVVDSLTADALAERIRFDNAVRDNGVRGVQALDADVVMPAPRSPFVSLPDDVVRQWLLPSVYERMSAGRGEFLAELRPGIPMFVKFGGIDYDRDEDAIAALDEIVTIAQRVVAANGGNVLQLTIGDKGAYLYAVFGAPVAHEDDAARACASALGLHEQLAGSRASGVRVGIAAGRLRSGSYGSQERRTYACLGDPVNLAARLMSSAADGGTLVSGEVRRAAGDDFDFGDLQALQVKGKSIEVAAAPLLGRGRRSARRSAARATTALFGREEESARLREIAQTAVDGTGQVVVVTGEGGIGKSRLIAELEPWLLGKRVRLRSGAASSIGGLTAYGVWRELLRDAWDIDHDASAQAVETRLAEVLSAVDPALLPRLPLLGTLVGVAIPDSELTATFDAKLRKTSLESLVISVLTAATARGPVAFLIDAAEHLDPLSWDLVDAIGRVVPRLPVLLVIGRRAEREGEPLPAASVRNLTEVHLAPLDRAAARALVMDRIGAPASEAVVARLVALADGNPFHLEELVNFLHDQGMDTSAANLGEIELPTSLHRLQLARIDDLDESPRRTLKVASVVGMRYDVPLVAGASPELGSDEDIARHSLDLVDASLVVAEDDRRDAFVFRNETTQRVAYETLPYGMRTTLHDRIVEWFEQRRSGDDDDDLDVLAHHASFGSDPAKKRDYLVRAGTAAQARYANDVAVRYFESALELLAPAERPQIQRRLGKVLELLGRWPDAQAVFGDAIEQARVTGDAVGEARGRADLAEVHRKQGHFDEARALLAAAGEEFASVGDRDGSAIVLHLQGTIASQQGDYDAAREAYGRSLEIRRALDDRPRIAALLSNLAVVAEQVGDLDEARSLNERALAVRTDVGDPWAIAVSQNNLGMIALLQEDYARATTHIEASIELAETVGDLWIVAVGQHNNGIAQRGLRNYEASGRAFLDALQAYVDYDDRWSLMLLAEDVVFLAVDTDQRDAAQRLLAGADALRAELQAPRPAVLAQQLQAALSSFRARSDAAGEPTEWPGPDPVDVIREVCRF